MVLPGFSEASGTSARNRPHEPTASKPVVPRGYVRAYCRAHGQLRRGGGRRRAGGRGRGGAARGGRPRGRADRGRPRGRRVLVLRVHAVEGAAAPAGGSARGAADPRRRGGRDG